MFYTVKNADREYELHCSEDEVLRPICTIVHEGWAKTIVDALNYYNRNVKRVSISDLKVFCFENTDYVVARNLTEAMKFYSREMDIDIKDLKQKDSWFVCDIDKHKMNIDSEFPKIITFREALLEYLKQYNNTFEPFILCSYEC
jgi:hypothetical protein